MSVSEVHGYTVRVFEDGWRFDCDAVDCKRNITIYKDGRVFDSERYVSGTAIDAYYDALQVGAFDNAETAFDFDLVAVEYGWQRGTLGVQRGHHYCALHSEEVDSCLWMM